LFPLNLKLSFRLQKELRIMDKDFKGSSKVSRRESLRNVGLLVGGALISAVYPEACSAPRTTTKTAPPSTATSVETVTQTMTQTLTESPPTITLTTGITSSIPLGLEKIEHFVFIMQDNRSFDHYFGTYPGVDGLPLGVSFKDPIDGTNVSPYHDPNDINLGGPHSWDNPGRY
jgi:hypothetical protein